MKSYLMRFVTHFFYPDIDLFASRLNRQLENYISWFPRSSGNYVRCIFYKLVRIYTLHFSSFQFDWKNSTEVTGRRGEQGHYSTTKMGNTAMVYNVIKYANRNSSLSSYNSKCTSVSSQQ